jgi:hypothetical protein
VSWNQPLRRRSWKVYAAGAAVGTAMWVGIIYGLIYLFH